MNHLGLVKVLIYELMQHHFDYRVYPGINYRIRLPNQEIDFENNRIALVKELFSCLEEFNVRLAASFARIRIENNATGTTLKEQMLNILSPDVQIKENIAIEMSKTFRINLSKISLDSLEQELQKIGILFSNSLAVSEIE